MISTFSKSFSSISVIVEIKAAVWERLDHQSNDPKARRVSHRGAGKCASDDPTCKPRSDLGFLTDCASTVFHCGKKIFPPLVSRPYGALETNCTLEEGSRKTRISQREKGIEKQERHGAGPVSVVPLERGVLSRRTVVAVETIKRAISDGALPLMSLIILLLTFCAVICVLQLHRPHRKLRSSF